MTAKSAWITESTAQREKYVAQHRQLQSDSLAMQDTLQRMKGLQRQGLLSDAAFTAAATELEQKLSANAQQTACLQTQITEPLLSVSHEKDAFKYLLETIAQGCKQFLTGYNDKKRVRHSL